MTLNESAQACFDVLHQQAAAWRCQTHVVGGAKVIDCGGAVPGGLQAGLQLARICMAGLADVSLQAGPSGPMIQVFSDDPLRACLASQYAGWQIKVDKFFAMGSGAMRAAYGKEAIYDHLPAGREQPPCAVGVLETRKHPTEEVIAYLVERLPASVEKLSLAVAPTTSIAGNIQVVARSLETALHKLHELQFDLTQVHSGYGLAPLPPEGGNEIEAIGRTNDAILYGSRVVLWVNSDDEQLAHLGPKVPSSSSADYGSPFAAIFQRYQGDFYKIDGQLFSPAIVEFRNRRSGRVHTFGQIAENILRKSFTE